MLTTCRLHLAKSRVGCQKAWVGVLAGDGGGGGGHQSQSTGSPDGPVKPVKVTGTAGIEVVGLGWKRNVAVAHHTRMLAVTEGAPRPCKRLPGHDHDTTIRRDKSSHTRIVDESSSLSAVVDRLQHTFAIYRHFALHCADVESFSSGPTTSCCSVGLPNISPRMRWLGGASLEHCSPKFRQLLALRLPAVLSRT